MRWYLIWGLKITWFGIALGWALHCMWYQSWGWPLAWGSISMLIAMTLPPAE